MKSTIDLEEHKAIEEKIEKSLSSNDKSKYEENDDMSLLIKKIHKKISKPENASFRNNYKNYQYDYEEDFYEPRY
ncbi:MAG: hypothetical protein ACRC3Y_06795 [Romboutsia sp.]|uniref:hypothetical protein n=1 Tax=Romboutsia sp. TaxID=1965302 RepID=UPI003F2AC6B2